ncbi:methionine ABC transporter substrate-binding protein [Streptomyces caatingaensis]|uniref:Lipoprotein n=1 Tax=Streptomyces caatingaensis TaxID=1678637 RepID=A0A0K9XB53_9ACTN|nr:methionine ABC transporter substrate-binding protein [Streptomyces caatingaensis]
MRRAAATSLAAALAVLLPACGPSGSGAGGPVRIGISGADPEWDVLADEARKQGVDVKTVTFDDYQLPNKALADGDIELNAFQHLAFLGKFNRQHGTRIVPLASTSVAPMGLYSLKHASVAALPDGARIAVPNDPSNQGRALLVLQAAGLVRVAEKAGVYATPDAITDNPRHIVITPVDAQQTPRALQDTAAAVINAGVAEQAGYDVRRAIFHDDPRAATTRPYVNVIAARSGDEDDERLRKIVRIYRSPKVQEAVRKSSGGARYVVDIPRAALRSELDRLTRQEG